MKNINLLPESARQRRIIRQRRRRVSGVLTFGAVVALLWTGVAAFQFMSMSRQVAALSSDASGLVQSTANVTQLAQDRAGYDEKLRFQRTFEIPVPVTVILAQVENVLSEKMCLTRLSVQAPTVSLDPPSDKLFVQVDDFLTVSASGMAMDDLDIAHFLKGVSASSLFSKVRLVESVQTTANNRKFHEFKITAEVPLNRKFLRSTPGES